MTKREQLLSDVIGYVFPPAERSRDRPGRFLRRWIVRSSSPVPSENVLDALASRIAERVSSAVREAYSSTFSIEAIELALSAFSILRVDDTHCVLSIESPEPEHDIGNAVMIATQHGLRALDEVVPIADLQGLPGEMWFELRSARASK